MISDAVDYHFNSEINLTLGIHMNWTGILNFTA